MYGNRNNIDSNLSMGEYSLLHYEDISEESIMNRIIVSTILQLHLKGFVEINENKEKKLIIKIISGTIQLKPSECFIYECLKSLDIDSNSVLTLDELNITSTRVFARNKNRIREMIIQEALEDNLIDIKKYHQKHRYFFRSFRIIILLILTIVLSNAYILGLLYVFLIIFSAWIIPTSKKSSINIINDDILMYKYSIDLKSILGDLFLCFLNMFLVHNLINMIYIYYTEIIIALAISIITYIKFRKSDAFTDKALNAKQNLNGLEAFLREYSLIENKKSLDIYIWEDYLAFSVLLGINQNISNELKVNLSPVIKTRYYDYYENRYKYKYIYK